MREVVSLNKKWAFSKKASEVPKKMSLFWEKVNLPHSWNAKDGQDGGGDYYRDICYYVKDIAQKDLPPAAKYYLEINGANSSADVYVNGTKLAHHDGGYSTWRVNITGALKEKNSITIAVDNRENDSVYPQMADFTFYGGLYRNVNLIAVGDSHFELENYGGPGIKVTPVIEGTTARVTIEAPVVNPRPGQDLCYSITDAEGNVVAECLGVPGEDKAELVIDNVHLWHGRKDPYLYLATVKLMDKNMVLDAVGTRFGCRTFKIDPEEGFLLNGESYPLRGVSRHQDRWGIGNALLPQHHKEDIDYICEMGATTIRLAHYQHDQFFYDLCDERGQIIWAEIPYISKNMPGGRENTVSQMKELITQNYNHPSIVVWGLSNEITISGITEDLMENHHILNDLAHEMDPTRLTTMAAVSMCDKNESYIQIPDTVSYNHYFGWYGGDTAMNGPWFDEFHKAYPDKPIGCSEYGCEALNWHTSEPKQGDYTEEYQAYYHEELIKQLFTRKYLWATHVWNMFDFGADARNEGGENGQNHKGLMTFDRKYKKDAFYAYKAWLVDPEDDPFVHICGKRYVDRVEEVTKVTVYSNLPKVELFANGKSLGVKESPEHFFYFDVPNAGKTTLVAKAGSCSDESIINKVSKFNEKYRLKVEGALLNWFDITAPEGYFSLNDKIGDIMANPEGEKLFTAIMQQFIGGEGEKKKAMGFEITPAMMKMIGGFTVLRAMNMAGAANVTVTKEQLLALNEQLNKIKK